MTQATESPAAPQADRSPGDAGWAALAGVLAGGAGLAVAELVAAVVAPGSSTQLAGGSALIDAVPPNTRALLAVYCYRRAHLAPLGLAIAASCHEDDLAEHGGNLGSDLFEKSRKSPRIAESLPSWRA